MADSSDAQEGGKPNAHVERLRRFLCLVQLTQSSAPVKVGRCWSIAVSCAFCEKLSHAHSARSGMSDKPMSNGCGGPSVQSTYWSATAAAGYDGGAPLRSPRARHSAISLSSVICRRMNCRSQSRG